MKILNRLKNRFLITKRRKEFFKQYPKGALVEFWTRESFEDGKRYVSPIPIDEKGEFEGEKMELKEELKEAFSYIENLYN